MSISQEQPALRVNNLQTVFDVGHTALNAVAGVSFDIRPGEVHGLVGESGSGKSITAFSVMGLLERPGRIAGGTVELNGRDIVSLSAEEKRRLRGREISMVFQDPMMTLNPLLTVGAQMIDAIMVHEKVTRKAAMERAAAMLARMGIPSPNDRLRAYPHQFSGGMRQRVAIAIALLNKPSVILADESTTALDVTIQAQILHEVRRLADEMGTAFLWITHDLSVVSGLADTVSVMYMGRIVEQGDTSTVLESPQHPYTRGLIDSLPSSNTRGEPLRQIKGSAPSLDALPQGCSFAPRCPFSAAICESQMPDLTLTAQGTSVRCHFPLTTSQHAGVAP
jgi:peptide/nickel transport system ATP-binding protein